MAVPCQTAANCTAFPNVCICCSSFLHRKCPRTAQHRSRLARTLEQRPHHHTSHLSQAIQNSSVLQQQAAAAGSSSSCQCSSCCCGDNQQHHSAATAAANGINSDISWQGISMSTHAAGTRCNLMPSPQHQHVTICNTNALNAAAPRAVLHAVWWVKPRFCGSLVVPPAAWAWVSFAIVPAIIISCILTLRQPRWHAGANVTNALPVHG